MMQTFRISDALRCFLLNTPRGPNLACPRKNLFQARFPRYPLLCKEAVAQSRDRVTLAQWDGLKLGGLASARCRAGATVWEVDHLYLGLTSSNNTDGHGAAGPGETAGLELLDGLVQQAGCRSAERILLRLPLDSPAFPLARRAGFFPCLSETLLVRGKVPPRPQASLPPATRLRGPGDGHGLFKLFSAATPHTARVALGLTLDQWHDAHDPNLARGQQWVSVDGGKIAAWLALYSCRGAREGQVLVHPEYPHLVSSLLGFALSQGGTQRWLVPDYQAQVIDILRLHDFHDVASYTMLIKTVAAPVMAPGMAPVEA